jgi:hypothetical protein
VVRVLEDNLPQQLIAHESAFQFPSLDRSIQFPSLATPAAAEVVLQIRVCQAPEEQRRFLFQCGTFDAKRTRAELKGALGLQWL